MKYNKTKIMSNAWAIRRHIGCTMSAALKQSWASEKASRRVFSIKSWFLNKEFNANERIAIIGVSPVMVRETEKAVFLSWNTSYGVVTRWVPKSCLVETTPEENTTEKCVARLDAIKAREARYESLISECRAHGIPARKGWKVSTMQQKLAVVAA